eukprot:3950129-Amphidinium_carterae.1
MLTTRGRDYMRKRRHGLSGAAAALCHRVRLLTTMSLIHRGECKMIKKNCEDTVEELAHEAVT